MIGDKKAIAFYVVKDENSERYVDTSQSYGWLFNRMNPLNAYQFTQKSRAELLASSLSKLENRKLNVYYIVTEQVVHEEILCNVQNATTTTKA